MKKRNRSARFLTCLLPCSLLMSSLPLHAQDPGTTDPEIQSADPVTLPEPDPTLSSKPAPVETPAVETPADSVQADPDSTVSEEPVSQSQTPPAPLPQEVQDPAVEQADAPAEDAAAGTADVSDSQPASVQADTENETGEIAVTRTVGSEVVSYRFGEGAKYASAKEALLAAVADASSQSGAIVQLQTSIDLGADQLLIASPADLTLRGGMGITLSSSTLNYGVIRVEGGLLTLHNLIVHNTAAGSGAAVALHAKRTTVDLWGATLQVEGSGTAMSLNGGSATSHASNFLGGDQGAAINGASFGSDHDRFRAAGRALNIFSSSTVTLNGSSADATGAGDSSSYGALVAQSTLNAQSCTFSGGFGLSASLGSHLTLQESTISAARQYGLTLQSRSEAVVSGGSISSESSYGVASYSAGFTGNGVSIQGVGGYTQTGTATGILRGSTLSASNGYGAYTYGGLLQVLDDCQIHGSTYALCVESTGSLECDSGLFTAGTCPLQVASSVSGSVSLSGGTFQVSTADDVSVLCSGRALDSLLADGFAFYQQKSADDLQAPESVLIRDAASRQTGTVTIAPRVDLSGALSDQSHYLAQAGTMDVQVPALAGADTIWLLENTETGQQLRQTSPSLSLDLSTIPTGVWKTGAAVALNGSYLRTNTALLTIEPHWIDSLDSLTDAISAPQPMQPLTRTIRVPEGFESASISWDKDDETAGFSTLYQATISATLKEGWQLLPSAGFPDGWSVRQEGCELTLTRTFEKTRKERLTVETYPQDVTLKTFYPSVSSLYTNGVTPSYAAYTRESDGSSGMIYFWYESKSLPEVPDLETSASWSAYQNDLELSDFELNIPLSGSITITNPPAIEVHHEGWYHYVDFPGIPIDVKSGWLVDSRVASGKIEYYLIEEGKEPVELPRGLLNVSKAGLYTIELRTPAQGKYAAGSARGTVDVRRLDGSGEVDASMEGWIYGQQPNTLQLTSEVYDPATATVRYYRADGPDQEVILQADSPAGDYIARIELPENDIYKACTKTVEFTISKAPRTWSAPAQTRLDVLDTIELTGGFSGDGEVSITSSNPDVLEITSDGRLKGTGRGTAIVTVSVSGSDNYEDAAESFAVRVGWQDVEWSGIETSIEKTYGDAGFQLDPRCTSKSEIHVEVEGDAIRLNEDGSFSILAAGSATVVFQTDRTDDHYASTLRVPVTIAPKAITVRAEPKTRIYGDPDPELTWSAEGLVAGDTLQDIVVKTDGRKTVGTSILTPSCASAQANSSYAITFESGTLTIEQRPITLAWSGGEFVYNGQMQGPQPVIGNIAAGDHVVVRSQRMYVHAGENYTMKAVEVDNPNYRLPDTGLETTFSIRTRELTASVSDVTKVYGQSDPAMPVELSGLIDGDNPGTILAVREEGEHAGSYPIRIQAENLSPDYELKTREGQLTITPRPVSVVWNSPNLIYNGKEQAPSASLQGVLENDQCAALVEGAMVHAGSGYQARIGDLDNADYILAETAQTSQTFDIASKAATVTLEDQTKIYGEPDPAVRWRCEDLVEGDTLRNLQFSRGQGETVGAYVVSASAEAADNHDYALTFVDGALTITPRPVSVSWSEQTLVYNGTEQAPAVTLSNVLEGDECQPIVSGAQKNAGSGYRARIEGLSSASYVLAENSPLEKAFSIERKAATVTAADQSRLYGQADPALTWSARGLIDGETLQEITILREPGETVGRYAIHVAAPESSNPNYALTFVDGTLSIGRYALHVKWDETPLVYNGSAQHPAAILEGIQEGDECSFAIESDGLHAGDGYTATIGNLSNENYVLAADAQASHTYSIAKKPATVQVENSSKVYGENDPSFAWNYPDLAEGDALHLRLTRVAGENAGRYAISADSDASSNPDYDLTFIDGTLTIEPRLVTVSWSDDPLVYNGSAQAPAAVLENIVEGDVCQALVSGAQIHAGSNFLARIEGLSSENYVLANPASAQKTFAIAPKAATVRAADQSKVYGQDDPEMTWSVEGLVEGDALDKVSLSRETGEHAGTYTIRPTAPAKANPDYALSFVPGTLRIARAPLTIQLEPAGKIFGDPDPQLEAAVQGWLEEDAPQLTVFREPGEDAGSYALSASIESLPEDYALTVKDASLTIAPRSIEEFSITLKDLLRENGKTLEQTLEQLVFTDAAGKEHPVTVALSDHQAVQGGAYTLQVEGTGNFTGRLSQSYVVLPKQGPSFKRTGSKDAKIGRGSLSLSLAADPSLPSTSLVSNHEDLLNHLADAGLIDAMALASIADGKQHALSVSLNDRSGSAPAAAARALAGQSADARSPLFSLSLTHSFGRETPAGKIALQMAVPQGMSTKAGTLRLMAWKDGQAVSVPYTASFDGTSIVFEIEPDTICQLQYVKAKTAGSGTRPGSSSGSGSSNHSSSTPAKAPGKTASVKTGTGIAPWLSSSLLSLGGLWLVLRKRFSRKNTND